MSEHMLQDFTAAVKVRPALVRLSGRPYWLSVTRACGHDEFIDTQDNRNDYTAKAWAARHDVLCAECRLAQARAAAARTPSLIGQPYGEGRGGSGGGRGSRRPSEHKGRPRTSPRQRRIDEALKDFNSALDFLAEVESGQRVATTDCIARQRKAGQKALHILRQLGAVR